MMQISEDSEADGAVSEEMRTENAFITDQQKAFFETFGYIHLPGVLRSEIAWITREHELTYGVGAGGNLDEQTGAPRLGFVDRTPAMFRLLDHPALVGVLSGLLGDDYNFLMSDGTVYSGDTGWHRDTYSNEGTFLKVALYLDPLSAETGALRVVPLSHRVDWSGAVPDPAAWGLSGADVPAMAIDTQPGDLVVFNLKTLHAAFGGGVRRMTSMVFSHRCQSPKEIAALRDLLAIHPMATGLDHCFSEELINWASPGLRRHLEQSMENEDHFPELVAGFRERLAAAIEPATQASPS